MYTRFRWSKSNALPIILLSFGVPTLAYYTFGATNVCGARAREDKLTSQYKWNFLGKTKGESLAAKPTAEASQGDDAA